MPAVSVRNWPLIDGGWRSLLTVAATVSLGIVALLQSHSTSMAILTMAAVILAMWRFWLPVHYHIHRRGIDERCLFWHRTIGWRHIQGCQMLRRGALIRCRPEGDDLPVRVRFIEWHRQRQAIVEALTFYCGTAISADSKIS